MDPLSSFLALIRPRSYVARGFDLAGPISIRFGQHSGIKCYALHTGEAWLSMDGEPEPVHLGAGECFLLPSGRPFVLATELGLPPVDYTRYFGLPGQQGYLTTINGGGDCFAVGGHFLLESPHARLLLDELPPILHVRPESDRRDLLWSLDHLRRELEEARPGSELVCQQLATTMLVQALRLHLTAGDLAHPGWLAALSDAPLRPAITAIHDRPADPWTLSALASRCAMSRSVFAARFKRVVGQAPLEYLTRWRMLLAADRLSTTSDSIAEIALAMGYDSRSAFTKAFRRILGRSPRQLRRATASAPMRHPQPEGGTFRLPE